MRNIQVRISVKMVETQDAVTAGDNPGRMDDGSFRIILGNEAEFDISRLENVMLRTAYPALRTALSEHLEDASKKKAHEELRLLGNGSVQEHASLYQVEPRLFKLAFVGSFPTRVGPVCSCSPSVLRWF